MAWCEQLSFDSLSPPDLFRYSRTSKTANQVVSSYIKRAFNVENVLGRFFTDPQISHFRSLQSQTGMLISGSTALQFFERTFYPESDLDLYVEHRYCRVIALWLVAIGYSYEARAGHPDELEEALGPTPVGNGPSMRFLSSAIVDYSDSGVIKVYNFHKSDTGCKIQLITSRHSPLELILKFHSTTVMNLITHDKAYSLYPLGTFKEHRSLALYREDTNEEAARIARDKYVARGWTLVEALTQDEMADPTSAFSPGSRFVGDSKCWTIPILPKLDLPEGYIEMNSWDLQYDSANHAEMAYTVLTAPTLRYNYLVKDVPLQRYILPTLFYSKGKELIDDKLRDRINLSRGIQ